jgi:tRNA(fMet)-specific endonuclease VapC
MIGPFDTLIAAQALRLGAVLVTHNTEEFSRVPGLRCEDWQAVRGA